jgi:phage replication O-like protein O
MKAAADAMNGSDVQIEKGGFVRIHHAIMERLAQTELTGRQARILWALLRRTYGYNKKEDAISLSQFCDDTRLKKAHASVTLKELVERHIIYRKDAGAGRGHVATYGFNKYFEQWLESEQAEEKVTPNEAERLPTPVTISGEKGYPKRPIKVTPDHEHTKDSKDKQHACMPAGPLAPDPFIEAWHRYMGRPVGSPYEAERITEWETRVTLDGWKAALEKTARKRAGNPWGYLETILSDYAANGYHAGGACNATDPNLTFAFGDLT